MEYSREFGSKYPEELISVGDKSDVDNTVVTLVNKYYALVEANDMYGAYELYKKNKTLLEKYIIDMNYINRLEEEIFNVGLLALKSTNIIVSKTEPVGQTVDSFWYQDVE